MFKELCTKKKLWFYHDTPEDFVKTLWQKKPGVPLPWIIYRAVAVTYMTAAIISLCIKPSPGSVCEKLMLYITQWAWVVQIFAFAIGFGMSVQRYVQEKKDPELPPMEEMPKTYMIMWCLYTTAAPCALGITFMYWVFLYSGKRQDLFHLTLCTHILNPIVILVEFFVSAMPYELLHVYWPTLFTILYVLFTVIYQAAGGTGNKGRVYIYKIMDWRYPQSAIVTCIVALIDIIIMHGVLCVLNFLKRYIKRCIDQRNVEIE